MVRFDKPCVNLAGAVEYFREHFKAGDYLAQEGNSPLIWKGRGAELLGLQGAASLDAFTQLCRGRRPDTGERIGVRDKGASRRLCFFGQISAPKDVSLLLLLGEDRRIEAWWNEAVQKTLSEIESAVATRVRQGGAQDDRATGNMVAAIVTHDSSRALDPQLHTHVCLMNVTFDSVEQRWKSVQPSGIYSRPGYLREVCYNKLAERMREGGYEIEAARGIGFNVRGVPAELREMFSKRRAAILAEARRIGATTQAELQAITAETRAAKKNVSTAALRRGWRLEAKAHLAQLHATIAEARGRPEPRRPVVPNDPMDAAIAHVFERHSVVEQHVLLREALQFGRGECALDDLKTSLAAHISSGELVRVGGDIALREALQAESEYVRWTNAGVSSSPPLGLMPVMHQLSERQRDAVAQILSSHSRITILQGDAGTGKTTCLRTILAGVTATEVFACAPTAAATDVLRRELTPSADTLQQLLANASLQEANRGKLIVVDEAGLLSSRQLRDLCRIAALHQNRLLLVGDTKQHSGIEAGDALRCLQQFSEVPTIRLSEIQRQRAPAWKRVVAQFAAGKAREGFDGLRELGAVHEIASTGKLLRAAAADYVRNIQAGVPTLVLSPVWSEIHAFTREVRSHLRSAGLISGEECTVSTIESLRWTRAEHARVDQYRAGDVLSFHRDCGPFSRGESASVERRDHRHLLVRRSNGALQRIDPAKIRAFDAGVVRPLSIAAGDKLLVRANLKPHGLRNGDIVHVASIAPDHHITLHDGRTIPPTFRHFTHGYATTSHGAQGKTVDRCILLLGEAGLASANLRQAYVSNSRFRQTHAIYTTDAHAARIAMSRPADRRLALELVPPVRSARRFLLANLVRRGIRLAASLVQGLHTRASAHSLHATPAPRR